MQWLCNLTRDTGGFMPIKPDNTGAVIATMFALLAVYAILITEVLK